MQKFFAYTRVSTLKQGEKGVSLQEQRSAISAYAERHGLQIVQWFEERLTAAKMGRPLFRQMLKGLQSGKASGVIIHKIDRGARNLRDWADLGELIDAGVSVHLANDSLDLMSRGGRLSADIQAVVAADYIRNLREETLKGIRGRLKQGLFPFGAPIGYRDTGPGQVKELDPIRAPLVRQAFELYASGRHTLDTLLIELDCRGLRTRGGRSLSRAQLSRLLNNEFYIGLIRIHSSPNTYVGKHAPLVTAALFAQVQGRLSGRIRTQSWTRDYVFRGLFTCSLCGRCLIAETQKGHVYYRCQTKSCPTRTFREEVLENAMLGAWAPIAITQEWKEQLFRRLEDVDHNDSKDEAEHQSHIELQINAIKARIARLIDAFVDGTLDKVSFETRKAALLEEQRTLEDSRTAPPPSAAMVQQLLRERLELASSAQQSYRLASTASKRELAILLCSNRTVSGKDAFVEPCFPFPILANRVGVSCGGPDRNATRTGQADEIARKLWEWGKEEITKPSPMERSSYRWKHRWNLSSPESM